MLKKLLTVLLCMFTIAACSSKPKDRGGDEVAPGIVDGNLALGEGVGSDSGKVDGLFSINFPYDQTKLTAEAESKLQQNAQWMQANADTKLQIEGHCDSRGSIEYNLTLGERRARKVKNHLVSLGVDGNRLSILSYGEEKPLDSSDSEDAHAKNRRANFVPLSE